MIKAQTAPPFRAYHGDDPFVFVCFSHRDSDKVYSDINWLYDSGVNIWYDEGVSPGHLWRDDIARAIDRSSLVLYFASKPGVESINCRKEVNYALEAGKPFLVIYLEEVSLPPGVALALGEIQGVLRYQSPEPHYRRKILEFLRENLGEEFRDSGTPIAKTRQSRWAVRHILPLALLLILGAFFIFRQVGPPVESDTPSALQFSPREWILLVYANNTDNDLFDRSLETALQVSLNESAYVNLFSQSRVRDSLRRMGREGNTPLDRSLGTEIALREGISAVVDTSIEKKNDAFQLNAEIIDPKTLTTVYSHSESTSTESEVLAKLSVLSEKVRSALGEPPEMIRERDVQLEQATTSSLDALRLYSNAVANAYSVPMDETIEQLQRALELDPGFALAHAKLATYTIATDGDISFARSHYEQALSHADRLSQRERLYVEASRAWLESPEEMQRRWQLLASVYPDEIAAHHNLGAIRWRYFNDFSGAIPYYREALRIFPEHGGVQYYLGYARLALGETKNALVAFESARQLNGFLGGLADAFIVSGDIGSAREVLRSGDAPTISEQLPRIARLITIALIEEDMQTAIDLADEGSRLAHQTGAFRFQIGFSGARLAISAGLDAGQFGRDLEATVDLILDLAAQKRLARAPTRELALVGKLAVRQGHLPTALRLATYVSDNDDHAGNPLSRDYANMLSAEISLARGDTDTALALLEAAVADSNLFQAREGLARIAAYTGDAQRELAELAWISKHLGQALSQYSDTLLGREMNLLAWKEARARLESVQLANRSWPSAADPQPTAAIAPSLR